MRNIYKIIVTPHINFVHAVRCISLATKARKFMCRLVIFGSHECMIAVIEEVYYGVITWVSCQRRKIAGFACTGNAGTFSRQRLQWNPSVSDPGMHHGTFVTHVPWCMSGSLTCAWVPGIPGACAKIQTKKLWHILWFLWNTCKLTSV